MFYVVSPPDETEWCVERSTLVGLLERDWPGVVLEVGGDSTRDVVWRLATPDGEFEGSQDRAGHAQYLSGPTTTLARYAHWWRQQVPADQALVLYDESYSTVIPLDPGLSEADLSAQLG